MTIPQETLSAWKRLADEEMESQIFLRNSGFSISRKSQIFLETSRTALPELIAEVERLNRECERIAFNFSSQRAAKNHYKAEVERLKRQLEKCKEYIGFNVDAELEEIE